jgi:2-dehydro-3-deoxygluconokinase
MISTFGEIMLRINPEDAGERITQAKSFRIEPGGSESNVAIALSNLGLKTAFITSLPDNPLADIVIQHLRQHGVDTSHINRAGSRMGLYWTETGIGPRNSYVIYDREKSAFSKSVYNDFNFEEILAQSSWFHFSGISPAVSESIAQLLQKLLDSCPCPYSVDLNFREKLWTWLNKDSAQINHLMCRLCSKATLIAGNETDFQNYFGIQTAAVSKAEGYNEIAEKCFGFFPSAKYIAISDRSSRSATANDWTAYLFVRDDHSFAYKALDWAIDSIADRVGTGDSFVAGIIFGLINKDKMGYDNIINFATALSALNHTTLGDSSSFSEKDVWNALKTKGSGRIIR